jgi:hypothetical protein
MITRPDAEAVKDIVLLEARQRQNGTLRPVYTEIDRVFLLCNACEHGVCEIDYWIRGGENVTECIPQSPCCPKCPQWACASGCHGGKAKTTGGDGYGTSGVSNSVPENNGIFENELGVF